MSKISKTIAKGLFTGVHGISIYYTTMFLRVVSNDEFDRADNVLKKLEYYSVLAIVGVIGGLMVPTAITISTIFRKLNGC
jgi:hypothetical protein